MRLVCDVSLILASWVKMPLGDEFDWFGLFGWVFTLSLRFVVLVMHCLHTWLNLRHPKLKLFIVVQCFQERLDFTDTLSTSSSCLIQGHLMPITFTGGAPTTTKHHRIFLVFNLESCSRRACRKIVQPSPLNTFSPSSWQRRNREVPFVEARHPPGRSFLRSRASNFSRFGNDLANQALGW